jgi:hypothetical protein
MLEISTDSLDYYSSSNDYDCDLGDTDCSRCERCGGEMSSIFSLCTCEMDYVYDMPPIVDRACSPADGKLAASTAVDGLSSTHFNRAMSSPVVSPSPKANRRGKPLCRNRECLNDIVHCATHLPILYCSKACQCREQNLRGKKIRHEDGKKMRLHETLKKAIAEGMDAAGVERLRAELNEQMKRL